MKLSRLGRIPQNFAGFHYQAHAYVTMKLRHEFNARQGGAGIWKKETDNTNPRIRFWEVIDGKKAHDILELEKSLKRKVGYRDKHAHNRPAASKVSKRWTRKDSHVRKKEKSATPDKDRKRKHESRHRDESRHEKSMSREKKRREAEEESWRKEMDDHETAYERKEKEKRESKERKESQKSRSRKRTPGYYKHDDRLDVSYSSQTASLDRPRANETTQQGVPMSNRNAMMQAQQQQLPYMPPNYRGLPLVGVDCLSRPLFSGQLLPNTMVPPPAQYQVPQFPIMQFQLGQPQYYHQFLVPPGLQMPPPMIIPPIHNLQSEDRMDILRTSTGTQPPQRPPSTGNPDYISPLKRETGIGQPGKPVLVSLGGTIVVTDR
uniref:Uncharacterized protein n=1 Tax=Romanomermis culicivorax TaxID=13658 RepID=A0A915HQ49_ROMCU